MIVYEWLRFGVSALLVIFGLFVLGIATFGIYRLDYVLNRIHVAAKCDTLGIMLVLLGLIVGKAPLFPSLKILLVIAFMWLANPVSNHLIVRLEIVRNEKIKEECEVIYHESA